MLSSVADPAWLKANLDPGFAACPPMGVETCPKSEYRLGTLVVCVLLLTGCRCCTMVWGAFLWSEEGLTTIDTTWLVAACLAPTKVLVRVCAA